MHVACGLHTLTQHLEYRSCIPPRCAGTPSIRTGASAHNTLAGLAAIGRDHTARGQQQPRHAWEHNQAVDISGYSAVCLHVVDHMTTNSHTTRRTLGFGGDEMNPRSDCGHDDSPN